MHVTPCHRNFQARQRGNGYSRQNVITLNTTSTSWVISCTHAFVSSWVPSHARNFNRPSMSSLQPPTVYVELTPLTIKLFAGSSVHCFPGFKKVRINPHGSCGKFLRPDPYQFPRDQPDNGSPRNTFLILHMKSTNGSKITRKGPLKRKRTMISVRGFHAKRLTKAELRCNKKR